MQTILAIDDERSVRESYRVILGDEHRLILAEDAAEGLRALAEKYADLILLDITMPGMSGLDMLDVLRDRGDVTPVVVVTGSNTVAVAVEAMKRGAQDFLVKPFDVDELLKVVERTLEAQRGRRELESRREADRLGFENIIGASAPLMEALGKAHQAMQVDSTVLITGETGTGKDVLARAIHFGSARRLMPYVPLCCSAIPESLVESELFGHERGAFTGATEQRTGKMQVADGGTLFLDEIGEMPMEAQSKLLRVLQDGTFYTVGGSREVKVDVRFICATNRNFASAIASGTIREDLYYRINVLPIHMPPLRKRREDIPLLVAHFVAKHRPRVNAAVKDFTPRAVSSLAGYDWPGNVRELENVVERILVCNRNAAIIDVPALEGLLPQSASRMPAGLEEFDGLPLQEATERLERYLIKSALDRADHVQSRAADNLGTTRRVLKYKMDQLGLGESGEGTQSLAS
ncbi:MAG: response regulator [Candidatus Hydrogenedens sp.]|nr:response regulator [Candidatus Hydrogenedens sp.]